MNSELKSKIIINTVVFIWIVICNLTVQIFLKDLENIGFCNWAFFLINILFFLMNDVEYKERFIRVGLGSLVGIFAAGMLIITSSWLNYAGVSPLLSLMIPLTVCLAVIIILHPAFPRFFNNCAFAYFLVSLIGAETAYVNMPEYMTSAVAGHLIVNIGTVVIIKLVSNYLNKEK